MDNIIKILREKKLKITPQRIAIYKYLGSTKLHPSAEIIYKSLQIEYPSMSLATVYKGLKTLVKANLIQELNVGEGKFRYDKNVSAHPHIQCINCGKVDDIENITFAGLNEKIRSLTDYEVISNKVYFYGICSCCKDIMQIK